MTDNITEGLRNWTQRELGEQHMHLAVTALGEAEAADSLAEEQARLGWANAQLLKAVYFELRHGHDLKGDELDVLSAHTQALKEHADEMDNLGGALRYQGDVASRR